MHCREILDEVDGVPLLDTTNPLRAGLMIDAGPGGESGGERIQALAPRARVVKVFNTTGFNNMRDPLYEGERTVMFLAGDDAAAKRIEHLAVLWISLASGGLGRNIAFRLVRR